MPKTVTLHLHSLAGTTGLKLFLYSATAVVSSSGYALTESSVAGIFTCSVTDALPGDVFMPTNSDYAAVVKNSSSATVFQGWLYRGETVVDYKTPGFRNYYISTTGDDSNDGSQTSPWATFNHAEKNVESGDLVIIEDGTYNQYLRLNRRFDTANPPTFRARNAGAVTFQSTNDVLIRNYEQFTKGYHFEGIIFTNSTTTARYIWRVDALHSAENITFRRSKFAANPGYTGTLMKVWIEGSARDIMFDDFVYDQTGTRSYFINGTSGEFSATFRHFVASPSGSLTNNFIVLSKLCGDLVFDSCEIDYSGVTAHSNSNPYIVKIDQSTDGSPGRIVVKGCTIDVGTVDAGAFQFDRQGLAYTSGEFTGNNIKANLSAIRIVGLANNLTFANSEFHADSRPALDIHSDVISGQPIQGVTIDDCLITSQTGHALLCGRDSTGFAVANNTIRGGDLGLTAKAMNCTYRNNFIVGGSSHAAYLKGGSDSRVFDNYMLATQASTSCLRMDLEDTASPSYRADNNFVIANEMIATGGATIYQIASTATDVGDNNVIRGNYFEGPIGVVLGATVTGTGYSDLENAWSTYAVAHNGYRNPSALGYASTSASQVRTELTTELANLDVAVSSRSTLTSGEVRTELAVELSNLDATVSSRSTHSVAQVSGALNLVLVGLGLDNVPSAVENASATRTELSPEMGRLDVAVSSVGAGISLDDFPDNFDSLYISSLGAVKTVNNNPNKPISLSPDEQLRMDQSVDWIETFPWLDDDENPVNLDNWDLAAELWYWQPYPDDCCLAISSDQVEVTKIPNAIGEFELKVLKAATGALVFGSEIKRILSIRVTATRIVPDSGGFNEADEVLVKIGKINAYRKCSGE